MITLWPHRLIMKKLLLVMTSLLFWLSVPAQVNGVVLPADSAVIGRPRANPPAAVPPGWLVEWETVAHLQVGSGPYLPFWARTGHDGILPVTNGGALTMGTALEYHSRRGWYFGLGATGVGNVGWQNAYRRQAVSALVDRLYLSAGWRMLGVDVGMLPHEREFGDLSLSGGNFMWSGNARNLPGVNLKMDWLYFEKGHWFGVKANFAHYQFIDRRSTQGAMLHDKSLAFKIALGRQVDFIFGLEHMAQWGGTRPDGSRQPVSFQDYLRIVAARNGGMEATESDQVNVLGNHLGHEFIRLVWHPENFTMTFQYDKPFEDGSGTRLQNLPDGLWTVMINLKDRTGAVTDFVLEALTTMWQSGPHHDIPIPPQEVEHPDPHASYRNGRKILGGCDNYFNNSDYRSGWTNYGRVIGMPLFTVAAPGPDGITRGIVNNRVQAFHFGMGGNVVTGVPYSFKMTYSRNYGCYHESPDSFFYFAPWQLSMGLEFRFEKSFVRMPVTFAFGVYGDVGLLYRNCGGLTFRVIYRGNRRF